MFFLLLLLLALHAIIHLLGAFKVFGWCELEALPLAISPGMGRLGLLTTVLLSAYLIWTLFDYPAAWPLGLLALVLSQSLIISARPEAKFFTLANHLLLGLLWQGTLRVLGARGRLRGKPSACEEMGSGEKFRLSISKCGAVARQ